MQVKITIIPNLFLVGWPKTGSTSLDYYLSQHPDIYMSPVKESYYFATDIIEASKKVGGVEKFPYRTDEAYNSLYKDLGSEKVIGESSVFYIISEVALQRIKTNSPDAKIIVVVRHPVEMAESWHHYLKFRNREDTNDAWESIKLQDERKKLNNLPPIVNSPIHLNYDEILNIKKHHEKLFSIFKKKNVFLIKYEDLKKDEKNITKQIFRFLEVDDTFQPEFVHQNVSAKVKHERLKKIIDTNKSLAVKLLRRMGLLKSNKGLHKLYLKTFTKNEKRQETSKEVCDKLFQRYAEQIEFYKTLDTTKI